MEKGHKRLEVWQKSLNFAKLIYDITNNFPSEEKYGLISQMRRAAVSVPSNIAEGAARQTNKDAIQFFIIARGSLSELDTHVELSHLLKILDDNQYHLLQNQMEIIDSLLSGLIRYRRMRIK